MAAPQRRCICLKPSVLPLARTESTWQKSNSSLQRSNISDTDTKLLLKMYLFCFSWLGRGSIRKFTVVGNICTSTGKEPKRCRFKNKQHHLQQNTAAPPTNPAWHLHRWCLMKKFWCCVWSVSSQRTYWKQQQYCFAQLHQLLSILSRS